MPAPFRGIGSPNRAAGKCFIRSELQRRKEFPGRLPYYSFPFPQFSHHAPMDSFVFAAVLFAAAAHAGWNAVIKRGLEPFTTTILISLGAGVVSVVLLPAVGLPAVAGWPWVIASVIIHLAYFIGLIESYRAGDMGQVYPIARGTAPLMTAMISTTVLGEPLGLIGWIGLLLLVAGVFMLSLRGGGDLARLNRKAVGFALFTAVTICAYSVVDGIGGRASGQCRRLFGHVVRRHRRRHADLCPGVAWARDCGRDAALLEHGRNRGQGCNSDPIGWRSGR